MVSKEKKIFVRIALWFFQRTRTAALLWLVITVFGVASYTTLLRREGFPTINIPVAIVGGTYFVNDAVKVDSEVAKPLSDLALKQPGVKTVQTKSGNNFLSVSIQYEEKTDAKAAAKDLEKKAQSLGLPKDAKLQYNVPYFGVTGGTERKIDATVSLYSTDKNVTTEDLAAKAETFPQWLKAQKLSLVKESFVESPFAKSVDPSTGRTMTIQKNFDKYGYNQDGKAAYYDSVLVGVTAVDDVDVIKLDDQLRGAVTKFQQTELAGSSYHVAISANYAPSIKESISELQRVLLEGLLVVLVVASLAIAVRASLITALSMITVLAATMGVTYLIGYTLNVITLFALILSLSLIVDDTIIMVEAIDAARRKLRDKTEIVSEATRKISQAMVAATLTACLSFSPLLFVSGILGSFIRAIPVVIISALLISLVVALIFIPMFSRRVLLGKKQVGPNAKNEIAAGFEAKIAQFICKPMIWAKGSNKKLAGVGVTALVVGFAFVFAGGMIAQRVEFNIFPSSKDSNGLTVSMAFPEAASIKQAEKIANEANKLISSELGDNFVQSSYYASGSQQNATIQVELTPYDSRSVTAPQLVKKLQTKFDKDFKQARTQVGQQDVGPPAASFSVQIRTENRPAAVRLSKDVAKFLASKELVRTDGSTAHLKNINVSDPAQFVRSDGQLVLQVSADFDAKDTTTLMTLAQDATKKEFTPEKVASYDLKKDALVFDLGQESENQDSFKTLALAFPVVLLAIYVLLALQFRSFLQPLLIFMAIPFSIFGVMFGLFITDNAISFFSMLGFFALIGLSIKNTILLTDFANQSRRSGMSAVDSAVAALGERFRPLFATSLTAVVSLIPLAIASPFWQGLAVVLIFGLLSSTILVLTVFPYYYLGAEFMRARISRRVGVSWVVLTVVLLWILINFKLGMIGIVVAPVGAVIIIKLVRRYILRN